MLKQQIANKQIDIGVIINQTTMTKTICQNGKLIQNEVHIHVRKFPLKTLRQEELNRIEITKALRLKEEKFYSEASKSEIIDELFRSDPSIDVTMMTDREMRNTLKSLHSTRYLKEWSDHGAIASHSYYLHMVQFIYDSACYLTDLEYKDAYPHRPTTNIQKLVEKPLIYIIARSSASVSSSLQFSETRVADLKELNEPSITASNQHMNDIFRISAVDGPERQLKSGQQIGGNYKCMCGVETTNHSNLTHCFRQKHMTLDEKTTILQKGILWKRSSVANPNPFLNASVADIRKELESRSRVTQGETKIKMQEQLKTILHGIQRVPDLLINTPKKTLSDINCQQYEVAEAEFMHDFTNCFANFMDEIPLHIADIEAKNKITSLFQVAKGDRGHFRGCDARVAAIQLSILLHDLHSKSQVDKNILVLSQAFAEISEIAYARDSFRTPRSILRYHNLTFLIGTLMKKIVPVPKKLSSAKYFGAHFHSITVHSALLYRLFCLKSLIPEAEEATFHTLRQITLNSSDKKPDHIIKNAIIRHKHQSCSVTYHMEGKIKQLMRQAPRLGNTIFLFSEIDSNSLQAHYERIPDYLTMGQEYWRPIQDGVMFLDSATEAEDRGVPKMKHFRSCNQKKLNIHLHEKWQECVLKMRNNEINLPLKVLRIYDQNGKLSQRIGTCTFFKSEHYYCPSFSGTS